MHCLADEEQSNPNERSILNKRFQAVELEVVHTWQVVV
jgi:hypothetical protein